MEIALSAAAAAGSDVSDIVNRNEKKVRGKSKQLRREVMTCFVGDEPVIEQRSRKGKNREKRM
jgi:hypothetical protein